ncbi:MAG: class I SAM-dependent methyltransferase [Planctomycetota bacterium]
MSKTNPPIAYDAYEILADHYAEKIDTKPHNAFLDRPAVISLFPELNSDSKVLDLGCGPGAYTQELARRGASVVACDISEKMLGHARNRLQEFIDKDMVELLCIDLSQPLDMFSGDIFDYVNAPLCLDYISDWVSLFGEVFRVLKPGGRFVFSCGHPFFDADYFQTENYFSVEPVKALWTGFGVEVTVPSFRRSLEEVLMPTIVSGLQIEHVLEPRPTEEFKQIDPVRYQKLMHRPCFICVRCLKP